MPVSIDLHVIAPFTESEIKRNRPFFSREIFTWYMSFVRSCNVAILILIKQILDCPFQAVWLSVYTI